MKRILGCLLLCGSFAMADDMDNLMATVAPKEAPVAYTFKSTQLVLQPTTEVAGPGDLDFSISHHLKPMYVGYETFFGLDGANIRLQLEYGIVKGLQVALGRTGNGKKPVDLSLKYQLLQQKTSGMPVTLTLKAAGYLSTSFQKGDSIATVKLTDKRRRSAVFHSLVARKFNDKLSMELIGAWAFRLLYEDSLAYTYKVVKNVKVQTNCVDYRNQFSNPILGAGGRYKLTQRFAVMGDIAWNFAGTLQNRPLFGVGVDIDTGGHVFQLYMTNQSWDSDDMAMSEPPGSIAQQLRLGFMIHRTITLFDGK